MWRAQSGRGGADSAIIPESFGPNCQSIILFAAGARNENRRLQRFSVGLHASLRFILPSPLDSGGAVGAEGGEPRDREKTFVLKASAPSPPTPPPMGRGETEDLPRSYLQTCMQSDCK